MRSIGSVILRMSTWRFVERTNADSRYQKGKYVEMIALWFIWCMQQTGHLTQSLSFSCPQNGGVSRGVGLYTDEEWRKFAEENVVNRFNHNPKKCSIPINQYFVGCEDVRLCSRLNRQCGFYLKELLHGENETTTWYDRGSQEDSLTNLCWTQLLMNQRRIMPHK